MMKTHFTRRRSDLSRRLSWLVVVGMLAMALVGPSTAIVGAGTTKWFVCKYTGTPGESEVLQTGQNPISVSESALPSPVAPGLSFNDRHGRSHVLVENIGQIPEPSVADCPPATAPATAPVDDPATAPVDDPATPEGEVLAATGTPTVTLPPTDTSAIAGSVQTESWRLVLLGLATLLAAALLLTPSRPERARR